MFYYELIISNIKIGGFMFYENSILLSLVVFYQEIRHTHLTLKI